MATDTLETPQAAPKEPVGIFPEDEHLKKLSDDADVAIARVTHRDDKFASRLDRRHAAKDGPEAVEASIDVRKREAQRLKDQEAAAKAARERAQRWIAPDEVSGRMDWVELQLHPEPEARKATINVRVVGEIPDGFVMIFEDPADPNDPKGGRVYESPRFGTKNRIRIDGVDEKGKAKGQHTHPGYFDTGSHRLPPGNYRVVAVDTDDNVLAEESFRIVPDYDGDGRSDQVVGVKTPEQAEKKARRKGAVLDVGAAEALRASRAEEQVARQAAKAEGRKTEPLKGSTGLPKETAAQKKAKRNSPEGRAS